MKITLGVMPLLAIALTVVAYIQDHRYPLEGLRAGGKLFWDIFPAMLLAFLAAGMMTKVLPRELLTRLLGEESGLPGMIIATLAGALTPGGPFIQFPIVATLLKSGVGIAPIVAYVSAWSLLGFNRFIVYEIPLLGWKLSLTRLAASMLFPIIIGIVARFLWIRL
jgi:uncharacterized membrane protein YraQ (UPF0718 family)